MLRRTTVLCAAALSSVLATAAIGAVRVAHLSPDAPPVDVFAGPTGGSLGLLFGGAAYPGVTGYVPVATGNYDIQVRAAGGGATVIDVVNFPLDGSTDYTIAAVNTLASITPLPLVDDNTIAPGQARVRFVHASPNAPAVDIVANGAIDLFTNVDRYTSGGYMTVPAGMYTLDVYATGDRSSSVLTEMVTLEPDTVYTAFAIGLIGDNAAPLDALFTVDAIPEPATLGLILPAAALLMARRRSA